MMSSNLQQKWTSTVTTFKEWQIEQNVFCIFAGVTVYLLAIYIPITSPLWLLDTSTFLDPKMMEV
jgi:hypothetical protein